MLFRVCCGSSAVVLLQDLLEFVMRKSDYGVSVATGHRFGGDHGVDDGFFGGFDGGGEEWADAFG